MFPGADDNASGSADVLEIAHAFAQLGSDRPKRSVVFALFGGEEMGLKGSYYMSNNFPPQFTRVAGMVNLDMTGEGDGAWCGYSAKDSTLKALLEAADTATKIVRGSNPLSTVTGMGGTDYVPFFKKEILCFTFGSNGPHLAYHQAGDIIYRINPEILADIARLGYAVAYLLADR
jgi:Zn-dependent M28 family amino/carboxypeptidase